MMSATTKALEWYAVALAAVHHYHLASMDDIATYLRVTLAEWVAIDGAWSAALSVPGPLAARFAVRFAQARKRLLDGRGPALGDVPAYLLLLRSIPEMRDSETGETLVLAASANGPVLPFVAARCSGAPAASPDDDVEGHDTATLSVFVPRPALPFLPVEGREMPDVGRTARHPSGWAS